MMNDLYNLYIGKNQLNPIFSDGSNKRQGHLHESTRRATTLSQLGTWTQGIFREIQAFQRKLPSGYVNHGDLLQKMVVLWIFNHYKWWFDGDLPSGYVNIAIEHDHRNSGFSH